MFYLFACSVIDRQVEPDDILLARSESSKEMKRLMSACNATETYVMNANDIVIAQSWPEEDAA